MVRAAAASVCAALLTLTASAGAEPTLTERLRLQGGYSTEARPAPQERLNSVYGAAIPELALFWAQRASLTSVTYTLTGALNSLGGASELSNRLVLASMHDLSKRTTMILTAEAAQTSFSNFLITQPASTSTVSLFPAVQNRVFTSRVSEGISYELSQRWRLGQGLDAGYITSIPPGPRLETFLTNADVNVDHVWRSDGVGMDLRAGYANTVVPPPSPSQEFVTLTGTPHWRHDWSNTFSTQVAAGASVIIPVQGGDTLVTPAGRVAGLYTWEETAFGLNYSVGVAGSPLTGQIIRSHQVTANVMTPISSHHRVFLGSSLGFLHGDVVDLTNRANDQTYDALLADVDITWALSNYVGLFGRYQFLAQLGDVNRFGVNPSFLRDFFLVGVQFSSRPTGGDTVPTRFPQRVDGRDSRGSVGGSSSGAAAPPK